MKSNRIHYEHNAREGTTVIDWNTDEYEPGELDIDPESTTDADALTDSYQQGWQQAIGAAQIAFVSGKIVEFFQSAGAMDDYPATTAAQYDGHGDPHHNEPEGTGEAADPTVVATVDTESGPIAVHAATDSGEPEKEALDPEPEEHIWHLSHSELNSRIEAAYARGVAEGKAAAVRDAVVNSPRGAISRYAIARIANEVFETVWGVSGEWRDKRRTEVIGTFAASFAKRLGWVVTD